MLPTALRFVFCGRTQGYGKFVVLPIRHSRANGKGSVRSIGTSESSTTEPHSPSQHVAASPNSSTRQSSRRSLRPLIYGAIFLFLGMTAGQYLRFVAVPPPLPLPNSPEDLAMLRLLEDDAEKQSMIRELRSHPGEWKEICVSEDLHPSIRSSNLTAGAMSGSRGLAVQKVFGNSGEQRTICVVFFGGAMAGWPGVTHGGAVATVLQENLERLSMMYCRNEPSSTTDFPPRSSASLEHIKVKYLRPTLANRFFVIRAEVDQSESARIGTDVISVKATLEEVNSGIVCAEAAALCRLPM